MERQDSLIDVHHKYDHKHKNERLLKSNFLSKWVKKLPNSK